MQSINVSDGSQVAEARRVATAAARAHGFDDHDAGRVSLVTTELATNLIKHANAGVVMIDSYAAESGTGIECIALDLGGGIADVAAAMRDGHSTAGSSGTGLGAAWRNSHSFDIYSQRDHGTAILCRFERGSPTLNDRGRFPTFGAISVPMIGEQFCGDSWFRRVLPQGQLLIVADGLGHGPMAAEASLGAINSVRDLAADLPSELLHRMHIAIKATRGAAVAIARLDEASNSITFAGIGNVAAAAVSPDGTMQRMVSSNGTIGRVARTIRNFYYDLPREGLVIMASDGIGTNWTLDRYPGLMQRHPSLIAAVLYRDFNRGRDDATVLVVRGSTQ